jgi:hypothetical protein
VTPTARWRAFLFGVVALGALAVMLAARSREHVPSPPGRDEHRAAVVAGRPPPLPVAGREVQRRDAVLMARRFAVAYARWDAGRHDARTAAQLSRWTTRPLGGALVAQWARPAARPAKPLQLIVNGVYSERPGVYRISLARRTRPGAHVATVLVTAAPDGPRVAAVER